MAEAVGFSGCSAEEFRFAAALHDVGKVALPDTILLKAGPLTPEEYRAVQHHTTIGYQLLAGSTTLLLKIAASIALGHHEWWDGSGYPRGLLGEDIPLEARSSRSPTSSMPQRATGCIVQRSVSRLLSR